MPKIWKINQFHGGLSTGSKVGVDGSFLEGTGLDFKTDPDLLSSKLKMVKDSDATVDQFVKWIRKFGSDTYFYGDGGDLYKRTSGGVWSLDRAVGSSNGQGLEVFNDLLYYAQTTQLGTKTSGAVFTDNVETLDSDTLWHPMKTFLDKLYIGHGAKVGSIDSAAAFVSAAITLPADHRIKTMEVIGDYLAIGTWIGTNITDNEQGYVFFWDGISSTWNSYIRIEESGVNAMKNINNQLYVFAGTKGNIYQLMGGNLVKIKRVPGIKNGIADIWPGAVTSFRGELMFGAAGETDVTTLNQGIYSWGQVEKNYPMVLNFDYPMSEGVGNATDFKIGAVHSISPTLMFASWDNAGSYGVDLISTTTPQQTVTYESLIFDGGNPYQLKNFYIQKLNFKKLPANTSIKLEYDADRSGSFTTIGTFTTDNGKYVRYSVPIKAYELQYKITLTTTAGTSAPELISIATVYDDTGNI